MQKTKKIDLTAFCEIEIELERFDKLDKPWLRMKNQLAYATDGKILVECDPRLCDISKFHDPEQGGKRLPNPDPIFAKFNDGDDWQPLPEVSCSVCEGTGVVHGFCKECNGTGMCMCDCGHDHDCGFCDGEFFIDIPCPDCGAYKLGGIKYAGFYIYKIAKLPDVRWRSVDDDELKPLFFKFTGGRGVLCGIK